MIEPATHDHEAEHNRFLVEEGLDLLSAFKAIKNAETRRAILAMVAAVAQGEMDAQERAAA